MFAPLGDTCAQVRRQGILGQTPVEVAKVRRRRKVAIKSRDRLFKVCRGAASAERFRAAIRVLSLACILPWPAPHSKSLVGCDRRAAPSVGHRARPRRYAQAKSRRAGQLGRAGLALFRANSQRVRAGLRQCRGLEQVGDSQPIRTHQTLGRQPGPLAGHYKPERRTRLAQEAARQIGRDR